jgi:hypothetical protein
MILQLILIIIYKKYLYRLLIVAICVVLIGQIIVLYGTFVEPQRIQIVTQSINLAK